MNALLANPKAIVALLCVSVLVVGPFFTLVGLWRRDKAVVEEASKWSKAIRGGPEGQKQQTAQLDELHRLVADLQSSNSDNPAPASNSRPDQP